jgi:hypothetical protein
MINQEGKILKQVSLYSIQNEKKFPEVNYKDKLTEKEIERDKARKSWGTVENIKELKEGLSERCSVGKPAYKYYKNAEGFQEYWIQFKHKDYQSDCIKQ